MDLGALTGRLDRAGVRAVARRLKAQRRVGGALTPGGSFPRLFALATLIAVSALALAFVMQLVRRPLPTDRDIDGVALAIVFGSIVVGLALVLGIVVAVRDRRYRKRWFRLERLAVANGMSYVPVVNDAERPGLLFAHGTSRQVTDALIRRRPRHVEFANYRFTLAAGQNQRIHRWGYIGIGLARRLPNIVLESRAAKSPFRSGLPASFRRDQRLSLEGDFDRYFTLYCPRGYERDALYLFTPDIMARFVDNAADLDVEIVDEWLFLYNRHPVSTLDPARWRSLALVVDALTDKLAQWERWRDERMPLGEVTAPAALVAVPGADASAAVIRDAHFRTLEPAASARPGVVPARHTASVPDPPDEVAPAGRRLKGRSSIITIAVFAGFAALFVVSLLLK